MNNYNVYFQNPQTKELSFKETLQAVNILKAQVEAVAKYKNDPDWYTLKSQLVVRLAR